MDFLLAIGVLHSIFRYSRATEVTVCRSKITELLPL